jgi:hypothetical protein
MNTPRRTTAPFVAPAPIVERHLATRCACQAAGDAGRETRQGGDRRFAVHGVPAPSHHASRAGTLHDSAKATRSPGCTARASVRPPTCRRSASSGPRTFRRRLSWSCCRMWQRTVAGVDADLAAWHPFLTDLIGCSVRWMEDAPEPAVRRLGPIWQRPDLATARSGPASVGTSVDSMIRECCGDHCAQRARAGREWSAGARRGTRCSGECATVQDA